MKIGVESSARPCIAGSRASARSPEAAAAEPEGDGASRLGISVSYLSQIETDGRPLTACRRAPRSPAAYPDPIGRGVDEDEGARACSPILPRRSPSRCYPEPAAARRRAGARDRAAAGAGAALRRAPRRLAPAPRSSSSGSTTPMTPVRRFGRPPAVGRGARLVPRRRQLCRPDRHRRGGDRQPRSRPVPSRWRPAICAIATRHRHRAHGEPWR